MPNAARPGKLVSFAGSDRLRSPVHRFPIIAKDAAHRDRSLKKPDIFLLLEDLDARVLPWEQFPSSTFQMSNEHLWVNLSRQFHKSERTRHYDHFFHIYNIVHSQYVPWLLFADKCVLDSLEVLSGVLPGNTPYNISASASVFSADTCFSHKKIISMY